MPGLAGADRVEFALLEDLHLVDVEVGAVRIEAVGQAVHRAVHHLVDVHVFDVVVDDQRDDVLEDAEVLIAVLSRAIAWLMKPPMTAKAMTGIETDENEDAAANRSW